MPSLFDEDFAIANDLFAEAFGVVGGVEIQRAGWSTAGVLAEVVLTNHEAVDVNSGFVSSLQSRDYLIRASDYKLNQQVEEPRPGDRVVETIDGVVCKFEVCALPGRPPAEKVAADGQRWLIRTKKVQ